MSSPLDHRHGFVRVATATPVTRIAAPLRNADAHLQIIRELADADVVLFPELSLSGYTAADLFGQTALLEACELAARRLVDDAASGSSQALLVVGCPVRADDRLWNCAVVFQAGRILGAVPKRHLPNYKEFYERRWFASADDGCPSAVSFAGETVPFGPDLLFAAGELIVGVEICEDLWLPIPPSSEQALAGATLLLNLSASNETVAKSEYRRDLVVGQSGRCVAAYAYASAGPTESTTDLVFSGHQLIAENAALLAESPRFSRQAVTTVADIDIERLLNERRRTPTFGCAAARQSRAYRRIAWSLPERTWTELRRSVPARPFVPSDERTRVARCEEIFQIQCHGLANRVARLSASSRLFIGVSGGLDSTLALLVAVKTCDLLGSPHTRITGLTMPGFGTTARTKTNAIDLMEHLGIRQETIDIRALCVQAFDDLGHAPFGLGRDQWGMVEELQSLLYDLPADRRQDLVFENVQARLRTFLLMSRGFVIGTGDLSELALGWCTYNGDHMSMYNPNCSIPKTLVKYLVQHVAEHEFTGPVRATLESILATTISPELLPAGKEGTILQGTEAHLGPYELHDFFLFHVIRNGFGPRKIAWLAEHARFERDYTPAEIRGWLRVFLTRFFANQFKRSCVPDGPKVGSVSLSPRGDWRMPSDAEAAAWLAELDA